jgi:carbon storage regulator
MLVLSRRQSETIVIGDQIRVQVLEISGGRVRLAIEAPASIPVDREEIWQRKQLERLAMQESSATGRSRLVAAAR